MTYVDGRHIFRKTIQDVMPQAVGSSGNHASTYYLGTSIDKILASFGWVTTSNSNWKTGIGNYVPSSSSNMQSCSGVRNNNDGRGWYFYSQDGMYDDIVSNKDFELTIFYVKNP